eukprot:m.51867 g.51867  ORF g.51867 m.51867 type:complete len:333 (+) comp10759_c0_seq1:298-1296(+)
MDKPAPTSNKRQSRRKLPTPGKATKPTSPPLQKQSSDEESPTGKAEQRSVHALLKNKVEVSDEDNELPILPSSDASTGGKSDDDTVGSKSVAVTQDAVQALEKNAELAAQLEVARATGDELMERALKAEKQLDELTYLKEEMEHTKSSDGIKDNLIANLKAEVAAKDLKAQKLSEESVNQRSKISKLKDDLEELEERYDAACKRSEEQAEELGSLTGELETLKSRMAQKEEQWSDLSEIHESQLSILQSQLSNLKGELLSLKSFSSDQNQFVNNLGEENAKLVAEIKRLKDQAKIRDQQLQESVLLARDAIIREKKKRAEWEKKNRNSFSMS